MKIEIWYDNDKRIIKKTYQQPYENNEEYNLLRLLNHARLMKKDVKYNQDSGELIIKLRRHDKFRLMIGTLIWINTISPKINSILTIKGIENCQIWDEDPKNPYREEVIIGGLCIENDNTIFLGAFCEHENPFHIVLKVKKIDIQLEDTDAT